MMLIVAVVNPLVYLLEIQFDVRFTTYSTGTGCEIGRLYLRSLEKLHLLFYSCFVCCGNDYAVTMMAVTNARPV